VVPLQTRPLAALSDVSLARMANRGNRAASEELVRRAAGLVGDLLRRMGAGAALADDVTQDAMVTALRSLAGYRGEASFATWSMKIAARIYLRRRAKEARFVLMAEPEERAGPSAEAASIARLDLDRALSQLSEPERLCVLDVPRGRSDAGRDRTNLVDAAGHSQIACDAGPEETQDPDDRRTGRE